MEEEETPFASFFNYYQNASETFSLEKYLRKLAFVLVTLFLPTILVFFNEFFFMPWQKMAAGVLPPGDLGLWYFGQFFRFTSRKERHYSKESYDKFGAISKFILLGRPAVRIMDPELKRVVLMNEGVLFKSSCIPSIKKALGPNSVQLMTGEVHRMTRALLARWLTPDFLQGFLPKVEAAAVRSVDRLLKKGSMVAYDEARDLTFNILCQLLLSLPPGQVSTQLARLFKTFAEGVSTFTPIDLPWTRFGQTMKARKEIMKILSLLYLQRKAELSEMIDSGGFEARDMLDTFILYGDSGLGDDFSGHHESGGKKGGYSEEEVCEIALGLFFAGHENTSTFITWLMQDLGLHRGVLEDLRVEHDEIAKGKAPGEGLTWADYKNMKLTQKVISETLRVHPTVPFVFRKTLEDVKIGEYVVPKGWMVHVNLSFSSLGTDKFFPEPERFDPDRSDQPSKPFAFHPFGAGMRLCPGMELARVEASIFLHQFIRRCEWKSLTPNAPSAMLPSLRPGKGYPADVVPRKYGC